jgi:hypothetical protein
MRTARFLFNDEMARAIVQGRKTVTRRPVVDSYRGVPPLDAVFREYHMSVPAAVFETKVLGPGMQWSARMPCAPGDVLIGRECWAWSGDKDLDVMRRVVLGEVWYRATPPSDNPAIRWRPSIHMPDWAARIRRRVVSVTVERLQDIAEDDAVRESIYAAKGLGWDANPWVWRIEFSAENVTG